MSLGIEAVLPSGRRVRLVEVHILPGQPIDMVQKIPSLVAKWVHAEVPYVTRYANRWQLSQACLCLFESTPMVSHSVTIEYSRLMVCWFTQGVDLPLRQLICEGLADLNWEAHAKDFHSEW